MDEAQQHAIQHVIEPILAAESAELVELSTRRQGGQLVVCALVDKVGGITIQDCARLNQSIGQALDQAGVMTMSYTLEVSSPGLDRPLVTKHDYERAIGEHVDLELTENLQGSTRLQGQLLAVQEAAVVLITRRGNLTIPLTQITRAQKAIRWSRHST